MSGRPKPTMPTSRRHDVGPARQTRRSATARCRGATEDRRVRAVEQSAGLEQNRRAAPRSTVASVPDDARDDRRHDEHGDDRGGGVGAPRRAGRDQPAPRPPSRPAVRTATLTDSAGRAPISSREAGGRIRGRQSTGPANSTSCGSELDDRGAPRISPPSLRQRVVDAASGRARSTAAARRSAGRARTARAPARRRTASGARSIEALVRVVAGSAMPARSRWPPRPGLARPAPRARRRAPPAGAPGQQAERRDLGAAAAADPEARPQALRKSAATAWRRPSRGPS